MFIILDKGVQPPILVLETDDAQHCEQVAAKYASQCGRSVFVYQSSKAEEYTPELAALVPPSNVPRVTSGS